MSHRQRESLQRSAVGVSFWIGACALVAMKGVAFSISGSSMVRASLFESVGDMVSSLIMWVTQARVADPTNRHAYPVGKRRLTPLGILFFAAFALSAMTGLVLESLQAIMASPEQPEQSDITAEAALRKLFDDKPRLRFLLHPRRGRLEEVIAEYSGLGALAAEGELEDSDESQGTQRTLYLLGACIVTKLFCFVWCSRVARRANSEIARTLATDHINDAISQIAVVAVILFMAWTEARGYQSAWLEKLDPAASFLLSLWIAYNWLGTALEQITLLSNHRVDTEVEDTIVSTARRQLEAGLLELCEVNAYHAGEGCAAELQVQIRAGERHSEAAAELTKAMEAVEQAILEADCEVSEVHTRLRSPAGVKSAGSSARKESPAGSEA